MASDDQLELFASGPGSSRVGLAPLAPEVEGLARALPQGLRLTWRAHHSW